MPLQKQIIQIQYIVAKLKKNSMSWHALSVQAPIILSVIAFSLILYLQPINAPRQIRTQNTSDSKNITHYVTRPAKVTQPVTSVSKVAVTPPSNPAPAATKTVKAQSQSGTPKTEPVVSPSPSSSVSGLTPTTSTPAPASASSPSSQQTTTSYTSINWSGYLAANGSFTGISGSWNATLATGNGTSTSADATWIGIGGVTTSDLIQVGTQNIITANGQVSTAAFYELLPNVSQPVPGITVLPGDSMTGSITEISNGQWTISITDKTDGESNSFTVSYASSLSSAEWIEEDPSYSFRQQIPFDNFHEASFTEGSTVSNGSTVGITASTAQPVTMVNESRQEIAVPSVIGSSGASFTISP